MTIDSTEFLRSSEHCLSYKGEVGYRNAISRAYYSVFHRVIERLKNIPACEHNHHANLIKYMSGKLGRPDENIPAGTLKTLSYELRQIRQARNEADYQLDENIDENTAEEVIKTAQWFFRRLSDN